MEQSRSRAAFATSLAAGTRLPANKAWLTEKHLPVDYAKVVGTERHRSCQKSCHVKAKLHHLISRVSKASKDAYDLYQDRSLGIETRIPQIATCTSTHLYGNAQS